jgi:hypothetical protein
MKTFLLYLLVFISVNMAAQQFAEVEKVESIYATQHYTLTIASNEGVKTYELEKRKTTSSSAWYIKSNKHCHKVIWDNYQNFERELKQNVYNYYNHIPQSKQPVSNYATYTISSQNQSITFEADYINVQRILCHAGWMSNPQKYSGGSSGNGRGQHG